jgi:hypothetical protein
MTTFKNAEYTITTSLSEQESSIYIKVANNISYATYEGTFERSAFRVSFEIAGIYRLINKCFAGGDAKYSVRMEMEPNALRLRFDCNIEEFLVVEFEIRLKEKMVANDAILSVELEKQKQLVEMLTDRVEKQAMEYRQVLDQQRQLIERLLNRLDSAEKTIGLQNKRTNELDRRIDCIGGGSECVFKCTSNSINNKYVKLDSSTITVHCRGSDRLYSDTTNGSELHKIRYLYKLNELILHGPSIEDFCLNYNGRHNEKHIIFANDTLSKLSIWGGCSSAWSDMAFIQNLPNLEELTIRAAAAGSNIQVTEAIETLKSTPHKIKKITFCGVTNAIGLQPYCDKNGIELIIT